MAVQTITSVKRAAERELRCVPIQESCAYLGENCHGKAQCAACVASVCASAVRIVHIRVSTMFPKLTEQTCPCCHMRKTISTLRSDSTVAPMTFCALLFAILNRRCLQFRCPLNNDASMTVAPFRPEIKLPSHCTRNIQKRRPSIPEKSSWLLLRRTTRERARQQ